LRRILRSLVLIPDASQGWILNILIDGYRIMKRHKIDAFMTCGPPMSTQVGGLLLKAATGTKWVADFRDPWRSPTRSTAWESGYTSGIGDSIGDWLELRVVLGADRVVTTATSLNNHIRSILPGAHRNKCHIIANGFDESDFVNLDHYVPKKNSKIKITYAGALYFNRNPEPLFVAIAELIKRGDLDKGSVDIDLVGQCEYWRGGPVQGLIDKYGLGSVVHLTGRVSYRESLERMARSDALLLFAQGQAWSIPGKVYDYLKLCKPIYAIIDEGDTKDLLKSFKNVFIGDPDHIETMRESFLGMIEFLNNGTGSLDLEDQIKSFDRRTLTGRLAQCLE
jgi:glycosyltransferase involved in cell wall biosynthesis